MFGKLAALLMVFCLSAQSLSFAMPHDAHHDVAGSVHDYFHSVGQPHSHDDQDKSQFEISYTAEAFDHSNPFQEGGVVGLAEVSALTSPDSLPDSEIRTRASTWEPPFLKYTPPPPKA